MPNLKDIRKRVSSVENTAQITKAMKMVSAAKLRRAQEAAENARPYAEKIGGLLGNLASRVGEDAHPFLGEAGEAPAHVVLLTSDRGLCGGYNTNLIKLTENFLSEDRAVDSTLTICGRRGRDYFGKRLGDRVQLEHVNLASGMDLALAREIATEVSFRFMEGRAGSIYLVYTKFQSAISQTPTVERLLPIEKAETSDDAEATDYLYEPSPVLLLGSLLSRYVETKIFQAMLEGTASEHGSRMTAMDNASRNAKEMIERLTLQMNRARQASITTELMEIVSGAEALNG